MLLGCWFGNADICYLTEFLKGYNKARQVLLLMFAQSTLTHPGSELLINSKPMGMTSENETQQRPHYGVSGVFSGKNKPPRNKSGVCLWSER